MSTKKQYADEKMYENKLARVMERLGVEKYEIEEKLAEKKAQITKANREKEAYILDRQKLVAAYQKFGPEQIRLIQIKQEELANYLTSLGYTQVANNSRGDVGE